MLLTSLTIDPDAFERATGWKLEPQGACKGNLCVPLGDGPLDARAVADRLGMALIHDDVADTWALGPETIGGRALTGVAVPDVILPDVDGNPFDLSGLRGQKVFLLAWASW